MKPALMFPLFGLLAACSTGIGQTAGPLGKDAGLTGSDYVVLDLSSGEVEPRVDIPDLTSNPAYTTSHMVFRRMSAGQAVMRVQEARIGEADERNLAHPTESVGWTWIAVFELTRGQWNRLGGVTEDGDAGLPVSVNPEHLLDLLGQRANLHLDIPTDAEWTRAATAGLDTAYPWGNSVLDSDFKPWAVMQPMNGDPNQRGPASVGSRRPNAWGLYDMQGNLWELVSKVDAESSGLTDATSTRLKGLVACGGSWCQGVAQARKTNRMRLNRHDSQHPLLGVRLVRR